MPDTTTTIAPGDVENLKKILADDGFHVDRVTLETLILMVNAERLKHLHDKTQAEFAQLKKRQDEVKELHNILKKLNSATTATGELDCSKEALPSLLSRAKELGAEINLEKLQYNKEERERLAENIRLTIEDLNVANDMQLQTLNRLTNERYESYQLANRILKALHDAKTRINNGIAQR